MVKDSMTVILDNPQVVGSGAYGRVYAGTFDGKKLATKRRYIVESDHVPPGCVHVNEVDVMCRISHPNILHAVTMQRQSPIPDSFKSDKTNPSGTYMNGAVFRADLVYLVSDAADGDLSNLSLSDNDHLVDERDKDDLRRYMWQILSALAHLHSRGYIHRDLKPSNILYFGDEQREIRLCDFDMCIPDIPYLERTKAMTPEYTPPEILIQQSSVLYDQKVDIWGAGHVLYHLVRGESLIRRGERRGDELDKYILAMEKHFFPHGDTIEIPDYWASDINDIIENDLFDMTVSFDLGDPDATDLLIHMLECDYTKRWTAIECLSHPFFCGKEIPQDLYPPVPNKYHDIIIDDHIVEKHFITEEMALVFDEQIDLLSGTKKYGFFLGLDILMRVCTKKYRGNARNLAICCFNLGMKFFDKEDARFIPIDANKAKSIEYNIISTHLAGRIYRDNVFNHINDHHKRVYRYLLAPDLLPNKISVLIRVIRRALED